MPLTILVPDTLRKAVESASGGKVTVLYTAKLQPSIMAVIPAFTNTYIDPGLGGGNHPMFSGTANRFIGMYPGVIRNGELLSLPGETPVTNITLDNALTTARSNGTNWGLTTNVDYAGLSLWCWKNSSVPRGNTDYGRSHEVASERGVNSSTGLPAVSYAGSTRTGSGPASWRHDLTAFGISDLCGNIWEWSPGLRTVGGEIQIIPNNDAGINTTDLSPTSIAWRAILASTGAMVTPGTAGTVQIANSSYSTADNTIAIDNGAVFSGMSLKGTVKVGDVALQVLKQHGIFPIASIGLGDDFVYLPNGSNGVETTPSRGGNYSGGVGSGVHAISFTANRLGTSIIGCRPAWRG